MKTTKIKIFLVISLLILFSCLSLIVNYYHSSDILDKNYIQAQVNKTQTLINNRAYVVSVLQAIEGIIDNNSGLSNNQVIKLKKDLPQTLLSSDYLITPSLDWRFNKLKKDLNEYVNNMNNRSWLLLNLTALKLELSGILEDNKKNNFKYRSQLKKIENNLNIFLKLSILSFLIIIFSFYYLVYILKQNNKFKLNDLSKLNLIDQNIINYLVKIEHFCQRINFYASNSIKRLNDQNQALINLLNKQKNIAVIIKKIDTKSNLTFVLLAELTEANSNTLKELSYLIDSSELLKENMQKSNTYITKIFNTIQWLSSTKDKGQKDQKGTSDIVEAVNLTE